MAVTLNYGRYQCVFTRGTRPLPKRRKTKLGSYKRVDFYRSTFGGHTPTIEELLFRRAFRLSHPVQTDSVSAWNRLDTSYFGNYNHHILAAFGQGLDP